jgi:tRNA 2-thiouridine synthesizing protein A
MKDGSDNTVTLDARGLLCPEPLMMLRNRVREMRDGEVIEVVATDPSTVRDFTDFCRFMGHQLIEQRESGTTWHFRIRKGRA